MDTQQQPQQITYNLTAQAVEAIARLLDEMPMKTPIPDMPGLNVRMLRNLLDEERAKQDHARMEAQRKAQFVEKVVQQPAVAPEAEQPPRAEVKPIKKH